MGKKKSKGIEQNMELERDAWQTDEEQTPQAIDAEGNQLEAVESQDAAIPADEAVLEEAKVQMDVAQLTEALASAQAKQEEYLNLAQRVQADFENFRRRNQSVRKDAFDDGTKTFVVILLPVVDNLERAIDAAKDSSDPLLKEGIELVYKQLMEVFGKREIKAIDRLGQRFDPTLENAVLQGTSDDGEPGTVCEVFQKGYQMGETILRHAMVKVVPE